MTTDELSAEICKLLELLDELQTQVRRLERRVAALEKDLNE